MGKLETVESQVKELSAEELARFRTWFAEFDGEQWDRQFAAYAESGKLDALADRALTDHAAGRSTKLDF